MAELPITEPLWETSGNVEPVHCLAVSPGSQSAAIGIIGGEIEFRNISTGDVEGSIPGFGKGATSFVFTGNGNGLLAGYSDGRLVLWDLEKSSKIYEISRRKHATSAVVVFPSDEFAASAHADGSIHLWDIKYNQHLNATDVSDGERSATGLAISVTGENLILPVEGGDLVFFEFVTKTERPQLRVNDNPQQIAYKFAAGCAAFLPDGVRFIFGQEKGVVRLGHLNFEEKPRPLILTICREVVTTLAVNSKKPEIAVGGGDGTLERWSIPHEVCVAHYPSHEGSVTSAVFSPDGAYLIAGGVDGNIRCYDSSSVASPSPKGDSFF
ncbi:MAG: WD40 repeat domain-containing protein [Planctomycetota bacterium]